MTVLLLSIALAFLLGMVIGGYAGFRIVAYSMRANATIRDCVVKSLFDAAELDEVERWKRGEFLM
jgi:uncharacterized protein YneF (UPF0154 family)